MMEKTNSIRGRLIEMEPGAMLAFPIEVIGSSTIRSYASDLSFLLGRRYVTRRDRATRQVIVKRER